MMEIFMVLLAINEKTQVKKCDSFSPYNLLDFYSRTVKALCHLQIGSTEGEKRERSTPDLYEFYETISGFLSFLFFFTKFYNTYFYHCDIINY